MTTVILFVCLLISSSLGAHSGSEFAQLRTGSLLRTTMMSAARNPLSSGGAKSEKLDNFRFLDNGIIRLGIDLSRGGTIGWLGPSSNKSFSLLNVHDFGRVVQGSFYSGPNPYNPGGKCSEPGGWGRPWPWNPIGAGDVYFNPAPILNLSVTDERSAVVFTQPMQWACDAVPCDCIFEQRITLLGSAAQVNLTMHTNRNDTTFYPGQTQELPAVYVIGDFCNLWMYNGSTPFTGAPLSQQPAVWGANAWGSFTTGERWMAFTNGSGWGVGVVSPTVAHFGAGFFNDGKVGVYNCTPKGLGPYDSPTGYIAPWGSEIIDPRAPFSYQFALVLGDLSEIRGYAAAQYAESRDLPLVPYYDFAATGTRVHCVYEDAVDEGLPPRESDGGLAMVFTGSHPSIWGPSSVFSPQDALTIKVNASYHASLAGSTAALWWISYTGDAAADSQPCPACVSTLQVPTADGEFHEMSFDLSALPSYTSLSAVTRIIFQPLGAAPVDPSVLNKHLFVLSSIKSCSEKNKEKHTSI